MFLSELQNSDILHSLKQIAIQIWKVPSNIISSTFLFDFTSPFLCLVCKLTFLFSSLMLYLILHFHHCSDFVLSSLLAFLSPSCLETQIELATIRLFVSVILDVSKNLNTLFTLWTTAFKGTLQGLRQFLISESPLIVMKNAFYFTVKVPFVLKIFKFLSWHFGHVEKPAWLER